MSNIVLSKHEMVVDREFVEDVFELAFGDDAINKGYTYDEVLVQLSRDAEMEEAIPLILRAAGFWGLRRWAAGSPSRRSANWASSPLPPRSRSGRARTQRWQSER